MVQLPLWLVITMSALILSLFVMIWSSRRTLPSRLHSVPLEGIHTLLPNLAGLTGGRVTEGNTIEVIQNGAFFERLFEDIEAAEETVHYESYVWWRGNVCVRMAELLAKKARDGVEVRLMLDALGSLKMERRLLRHMRDAGCQVKKFRPFSLRDIGRLNSRDHRKIAVIDGCVGYLMGHGVSDFWTGNAEGPGNWRDTAVRLTGPAVGSLQSIFLRQWLDVTGEAAIGSRYFPDNQPTGDVEVHVAASAPEGTHSSVELLYKLAIASAKESIVIQNPYFTPRPDLLELLVAAVAKGVRVRIMLPSRNDSLIVKHASHQMYLPLLEAGVELYQYHLSLAHQKVMVIDGTWSHVGSTNLDDRSLQINREISLGISDRPVAAILTRAFEQDLAHATRVTREDWEGRSFGHRLLDRTAYLFKEQI